MPKIPQPPTRESVLKKIAEFDRNGQLWFIRTYSVACPAVCHFVSYKGVLYDLKALCAASYTPKVYPSTFNTQQGAAQLRKLGFTCVNIKDVASYHEGERRRREITYLNRSQPLVIKAKSYYDPICMVCGFDFERRYGKLGRGYIECHHIDPLSGRDGLAKPTKLEHLAMVCANCHRMIHRKTPCMTIGELKALLQS